MHKRLGKWFYDGITAPLSSKEYKEAKAFLIKERTSAKRLKGHISYK